MLPYQPVVAMGVLVQGLVEVLGRRFDLCGHDAPDQQEAGERTRTAEGCYFLSPGASRSSAR